MKQIETKLHSTLYKQYCTVASLWYTIGTRYPFWLELMKNLNYYIVNYTI